MLVMLICIIVGAIFFGWLQDEEYMKFFNAMLGAFIGALIGFSLSLAIGLAVVPTTTTKVEEYNITKYYIDDNELYYESEDGTMGRINIDTGNIKTSNKTYIKKRYYKVNKIMNFIVFCANGTEKIVYLKGVD